MSRRLQSGFEEKKEMPSTQTLVVILILAAALTFAAVSIYRKRRSFSTKHGCDTDCGCGK